MWIVQLALRRPYTFVVASLLVILLGVTASSRMPKDIFPEIDIPVVTTIWTYSGLSAQDMERQITTFAEFALNNNVNEIRSIESQTLPGLAVVKVSFQPGTNIDGAIAQVTAVSQTILRRMPPGTNPPLVIRYNAASVPILQMALASSTASEAALEDFGRIAFRQKMSGIVGMTLPLPIGGKVRQIMVDLDPELLQAHAVTADDVARALSAQNFTLPAGATRLGDSEMAVQLNSSPDSVAAINDLPVRSTSDSTLFIRDVANVRDGYAIQTQIARLDGNRSSIITILKRGGASTLNIVAEVLSRLPSLRDIAPPGFHIEPLADQSQFVRNAINGVLVEGAIAACLTAAMILLFLGSWRSTLIVATSIPLSILTSVTLLSALGYTLNIMTLGGLALSIGILVDDATVEIENIHRHLGFGKPLKKAILDGAQQIAVPAFVGTTAICIVFVSVVFLRDVPRELFVPFALAVAFAVGTSYIVSRTIIPTLVMWLLKPEISRYAPGAPDRAATSWNPFTLAHAGFNGAFTAFRALYSLLLSAALRHRLVTSLAMLVVVAASAWLVPQVGRDFFPSADEAHVRLGLRFPAHMRIERTEIEFQRAQDLIRAALPEDAVDRVLDVIGAPANGLNAAFQDSVNAGPFEGEMALSINPSANLDAPAVQEIIRQTLARHMPEAEVYFKPADMVNQVLNAGIAAPINIQVSGNNRQATLALARRICADVARVPGVADARLGQVTNAPVLNVAVDRTRASESGLSQREVANTVLASISSTSQTQPSFWVDPRNGISYFVAAQTPMTRLASVADIENQGLSVPTSAPGQVQTLGNVADFSRSLTPANINRYDLVPTFDVLANVTGVDLGSVAGPIDDIISKASKDLPPGITIRSRGQLFTMTDAYSRLVLGLGFASLLVYLLMVVNFQSWTDPFVVALALPGALSGIAWMLFATNTTFSVPALMGAIMVIGVVSLNAILFVTFANEMLATGLSSKEAALAAGRTRLRPILMTAAAMTLGMLPMAAGLGEAGAQNAPLGRAVIGGLAFGTATTLFFVPVMFSLLRRRPNPILVEKLHVED
jgi:multidrug efflux pump subunit AcrB